MGEKEEERRASLKKSELTHTNLSESNVDQNGRRVSARATLILSIEQHSF